MTHPVDDAVRTADPLPDDAAAQLPIADAEQAMLAAIVAHPAPTRRSRAPRPRPRRWALIATATATAAAAIVAATGLAPTGDDRRAPGPESAFAAELVRFAEASPLVLLDLPGWRVDYADEQSADEGEMHFLHGTAPAGSLDTTVHADGTVDGPSVAERQRHAELLWLPAALDDAKHDDRAHGAERTTTAPVLGTTARVYVYAGGRPGDRDITALFRYDGRLLEYRAAVPDLAAFKRQLAGLRAVDTDTWLRALPPSVVKAGDRDRAIETMLDGIPLPPGFAPESLRGETLTKDRYQLGALVAGTIACRWFARWGEARATGDETAEREAVRAMATAKDWPILRDMADEGAYTDVLVEYASEMTSGLHYGRPLLGDVDEGLGCAERGVDLP